MPGTRSNPGSAETIPTSQPSKQPKNSGASQAKNSNASQAKNSGTAQAKSNGKSKSSPQAPPNTTADLANSNPKKTKDPKAPKKNSKDSNTPIQSTAPKKPAPHKNGKKGPKTNENIAEVNPAAEGIAVTPTPTTAANNPTLHSENPTTGNPSRPLATISNSLEAQLRQRIAELEDRDAQNALKAERLERQIQRLKSQKPGDMRPEEVPLVSRPKGKFSIRAAMGLGDDEDRAEYKRLVGVIQEVVSLAKLDYTDSWKSQDTTVLGNIFRAAAKREPTLLRFRKHWATSAIVQQYFHNTRAYRKAKTNPDSGVMRRRAKITKVGRREAAAHSGNVDEHSDSESGGVGGGDGNEIGGNPQDDEGASDDNMSEGSVRGGGSEDGEEEEENEGDGAIPNDDDGAGSDGIND